MAFDEGFLLQPFAIIQIADHGAFGARGGTVHSLVVTPEQQRIDRPGVIDVLGQTVTDRFGERVECGPGIALMTTPEILATGAIIIDSDGAQGESGSSHIVML